MSVLSEAPETTTTQILQELTLVGGKSSALDGWIVGGVWCLWLACK